MHDKLRGGYFVYFEDRFEYDPLYWEDHGRYGTKEYIIYFADEEKAKSLCVEKIEKKSHMMTWSEVLQYFGAEDDEDESHIIIYTGDIWERNPMRRHHNALKSHTDLKRDKILQSAEAYLDALPEDDHYVKPVITLHQGGGHHWGLRLSKCFPPDARHYGWMLLHWLNETCPHVFMQEDNLVLDTGFACLWVE